MKLITKELEKKFKKYPLYSQDGLGGDAKVIAKFFNPVGVGTWLITEGNKLDNGDYEMFGYCHLGDDYNAEFGYVMLSDLENIKLPLGMGIERDLYLKENQTLIDVMKSNGMSVPDYLINDNLDYIKNCKDYSLLKDTLSDNELIEINSVIKEFDDYVSNFDDGEKDIISEYESKYGNYNIIDWYEGLKSTESFLEEFTLCKGDDSIEKYDAYFDMITPIKYLNNKDSFTIARVIDGLHCIELDISNGVSTIEKGIRLEEDYWESEIEEINWFNFDMAEEEIADRLWKLFDYNFGEENGKEF